MKILLIQPKMNRRPMDTDLKTHMAPSLALLTLMSLTPKFHEIRMINENIERLPLDLEADLVGITVTLDGMPRACRIAKEFRKRGVSVVAGGIHVTCCPETCQLYFDAICVGPAERVWGKIINDAENGRLNKVYKDMEGFRGEEIVSPLYGTMDTKSYLYTNVVTTSRGCPNRCDFCYNSCKNRIYVQRPVSDVIRDIRLLDTRHILFIDDNFIGNYLHTWKLLEEIGPMNLIWSAAVTANIVDYPDLLDLMAKTGCQSLFIGFESINSDSLNSVNKNNNVEKYESLVKAIHGRGMMINASMVFGLDGDSPETFKRTLRWLVDSKIETLTSHILTPYPGTALYRRMKAAGRIISYDLEKYNTANVVFSPAQMTPKELYGGYLGMYRKFYSFRNILRRLPESKAQRRSYLMFNLFYRKFGKTTSILARLVPMRMLGNLAAKLSYKI